MADIKSLLNPVDESRIISLKLSETIYDTAPPPSPVTELKRTLQETTTQLPSPSLSVYSRDFSPPSNPRKKQKVSKDAAVFTRGNIRGECRYPPDEFRDGELEAYHQQYEIFPVGDIVNYPRHIPYNSEKKTFLDSTGRDFFEVLHYNFKIPGDEKVHCMMWDYNIGLVRITPLFKCTGYSKTTPAKMLNRNVGLREICHSITGGALVAQGYWMPFEAAKAIAATFCWSIRYALTPVFGRDFPSTCFPPDSERFGDMVIDAAITRQCTEQAKEYRSLEKDRSSRAASAMPSPMTPDTPTYPRHIKSLRAKPLKVNDHGSGYSTDVSNDDAYSLSSNTPIMSYRNVWTPANTPRSVVDFETRLPSPQEILDGISASHGRHADLISAASASSSNASSPPLSPKSTRRHQIVRDEEYDGDSSSEASAASAARGKPKLPRGSKGVLPSDEKAACLLMGLKLGKESLGREEEMEMAEREMRGLKRRASEPTRKMALVKGW